MLTFKQFLEAKYVGNIGMMEMFKFYEVATPAEKARMKDLLMGGKRDEAWVFLQKITGLQLT
jgi:hypothetical protein